MKQHELTIQGMSCGHCVMHIKKALGAVDGVTIESVEIGKAIVGVDEAKVSRESIAKVIEDAGYSLVS